MKKLFIAIILTMMIVISVKAPAAAGSGSFDVRVNSPEASINFRSDPSTNSYVVFEIPNGRVLTIYDIAYNAADDLFFGYTAYSGISGWVSLRQTDFLTDVPDFYVKVNSSEGSINFRSGPSRNSAVITEIPYGTPLCIASMSYNETDDLFFGLTTYNGISGWVSLRQTRMITGEEYAGTQGSFSTPSYPASPVQAPGQYETAGNVSGALQIRTDVGFNGNVTVKGGSINFRPIPSTASDILCEIPDNTVLTIYDIVRNEDLNWGYTQYSGMYGWVSLRHTATPFHTYQMPDYIREWEGAGAAGNTAAPVQETIVGNWEYNSYDETPNAYHHAGYCFYEDGTGLDTFWNETFTYSTGGDIVTITFDDPEYGTEYFAYSFREAFSGSPEYAQYGIKLDHRVLDSQGKLVPEEQLAADGQGHSSLHFADLSEERKAAVSIDEDTCKSWNNRWYITTQDKETVTIKYSDTHYNLGSGDQIIPERINGHRVTGIADKAFGYDSHDSLIVSEGIRSIGSEAFLVCDYRTITLPASLQYIGDNAFSGCRKLEMIYVPQNSYAADYVQSAGLPYQFY